MVNTDVVWAEPARFTANAFVSVGEPAYVYRFSYVPAALQQMMRNGAPHGSEVPYVFNNLRDFNNFKVAPRDKEVAGMMNTYWANFAKTGNPNGKGLTTWPAFNPEKDTIIDFRPDGSAKGEADPNKARLDVIEKAAKSGIILLRGGI